MTERPILFSGEMVRAILEGRKTQTRRVVKPQPECRLFWDALHENWSGVDFKTGIKCPYGRPGDRLWVREAWAEVGTCDPGLIVYRADYPYCVPRQYENVPPSSEIRWKPSIHHRREHSRILLEIVSVGVERLNGISEDDAKAEGAMYHDGRGIGHSGWRHDYKDVYENARSSFTRLWQEINGPGSWAENPWVWVVEFRRVMP